MSTPDTEKRAPVQGYPGGIPWALHLEAYEVYCKRWGPQPALIDLEGRNCRGGFGTGELDDFIPGWRDRVAEFGLLKTEVTQLRARVAYQDEVIEQRNTMLSRLNQPLAGFRASQIEAGIPDEDLMPEDPGQAVEWLLKLVPEWR